MQQSRHCIMSRCILNYRLYSLGFGTTVSLLCCNQEVDVVVLVAFRWVHAFFLSHSLLFLNCVTPVTIKKAPHGLLPNSCLEIISIVMIDLHSDQTKLSGRWIQKGFLAIAVLFNFCLVAQLLTLD